MLYWIPFSDHFFTTVSHNKGRSNLQFSDKNLLSWAISSSNIKKIEILAGGKAKNYKHQSFHNGYFSLRVP